VRSVLLAINVSLLWSENEFLVGALRVAALLEKLGGHDEAAAVGVEVGPINTKRRAEVDLLDSFITSGSETRARRLCRIR
jgi:sulfur carrier protein ThiS